MSFGEVVGYAGCSRPDLVVLGGFVVVSVRDLGRQRMPRVALAAALALAVVLVGCREPQRTAPADASASTAPTPPATASTAPATSAARVVAQGVQALGEQYYDDLPVPDLYADAWDGAAQALQAGGIGPLPPRPAYVADPAVAARQHQEAFAVLAQLGGERVRPEVLARVALHTLAVRRGDPHTSYRPPELVARDAATRQGEAAVQLGLGVSRTSPPRVVRVPPGSPADRAGLQLGQVLVAVNGTVVGHGADIPALVDVRAGVPNTFTVRGDDGQHRDLTVLPAAYTRPLAEHRVLDGRVGWLRFDGFPDSDALVARLREALREFERADVRGWVLDLRENGGGVLERVVAVVQLFVDQGVLIEERRRGRTFQTLSADGTALAWQRPLVVLVGPGSFSGGEIVAAILQEHGRATVVGEPTGGGFGSAAVVPLADGSALNVTATEVTVGPARRRLNRVGLTPDQLVVRTHADVVAGRDPQLDAALALLTDP